MRTVGLGAVWLAAVAVAGCSQADPGTGGGAGASGGGAAFVPDGAGASGQAGAAGAAGGAGLGDPQEPTPEPEPPGADYYPVAAGASWVYLHTGGSQDWNETVSMETGTFQGQPAFLTTDTAGPSGSNTDSIWVVSGSAVLRVHKEVFTAGTLEQVADYVPGFTRFDAAWLDQAVGFQETLGYDRTEYDGSGAVVAMGPREHTFTVEALDETVRVPAGSFDGCLRVRRSRVRDAASAAVEGDDKRIWFCAGVGKVREEDLIVGELEELVSCQIPGGSCP